MEKKYIPLAQFFQNSSGEEITLTYAEIETIMGHQLPNTAYLNMSWWKKNKRPFSHYEAWTNAGYFVKSVALGSIVTFTKQQAHGSLNINAQEIITVREMEAIDCKSLLQLKRAVFENAPYDVFNREQYTSSIQSIRQELSNRKKDRTGMILLALFNTKVVGYIEITKSLKHYNQHIAQIHFGVLDAYSNKGIGHQLVKAAKSWCQQNQVTRIEAAVCEKNHFTLQLLASESFIQEGIRLNAYMTPSETLHEIYLAHQL